MCDSDQIEQLRHRVLRLQELRDRKLILELQKIELTRRENLITDAQASEQLEALAAELADDLVERVTFKSLFCKFYKEKERITDTIEAYADLALFVITSINPVWIVDQVTTSVVSLLAGTVLVNKTVKAYCG